VTVTKLHRAAVISELQSGLNLM